MSHKVTVELAGIKVSIEYISDEITEYFSRYAIEGEPELEVHITPDEVDRASALYGSGVTRTAAELNILTEKAGSALMDTGRCIFHGVAFLWRGRAWIFTAPSGTGKTTQYVQWKLARGDEIQMINGDKPILEFRGGEIWVHSSPWSGKENMHQDISAPLGGIIYLRQSKCNTICRMDRNEAAGQLFLQMMFYAAQDREVHQAARMVTELIGRVPVYRLDNLGDAASARLTYDYLMKETEGGK